MGIFSRLNTVIRSNLNALVDKAEDPDKLIGQTISEMESETKRARRELVTTLGNAKRLLKKHRELEEEAQGWENKAELALRQGDEALAREALRRKQRVLKEAESVKEQAQQQDSAASEMKATLERIESKIEDLKSRKGSLASQVRRARQAPAEQAGGETSASSRLGGSETFADLERMTNRIDQLDAEVEAADVLDEPRKAELETRFRDLEKGAEGEAVEDELSALKKKLER